MYSPIKITFLPLSFRKEKENIFISRSLVTHHHNVISKRNKEMKNICVYNSTEFSDFACCRTQNFILFSFYFSFSIFRERQKKKEENKFSIHHSYICTKKNPMQTAINSNLSLFVQWSAKFNQRIFHNISYFTYFDGSVRHVLQTGYRIYQIYFNNLLTLTIFLWI